MFYVYFLAFDGGHETFFRDFNVGTESSHLYGFHIIFEFQMDTRGHETQLCHDGASDDVVVYQLVVEYNELSLYSLPGFNFAKVT